jgi:CRP-like cAMP-binding protein|tara:strand:+ start:278 stop:433 length:156 start_codon:yes stop_codon:yes gene_type:complete
MDSTQIILSLFTKGATIGEKGLIDMNSKRSATAKVIKVPKIWFFQEKISAI